MSERRKRNAPPGPAADHGRLRISPRGTTLAPEADEQRLGRSTAVCLRQRDGRGAAVARGRVVERPPARRPRGPPPCLPPSPAGLPQGHFLLEPYLFDVITTGHIDASGSHHGVSADHNFGSLIYMLYGARDRL